MKKLSLILGLISLSIASNCSATAWHVAAENENIEELERLIQTEPQNINQQDIFGQTPLEFAAFSGNEGTITILLVNGSQEVINQPDFFGKTPLHWAAYSGSEAAIRILLETLQNLFGNEAVLVAINQTDNNGRLPLHYAAESGNEGVITILLVNGAQEVINEPDLFGKTPLHWAAYSGSEAASKVLLAYGANTEQWVTANDETAAVILLQLCQDRN